MFFTILIFIIILALLILSHELGHFIFAKRAGVRVEEFGFGFPPRIFSVKKGETVYSLNLIPLGGFVKIYGEDKKVLQEPEKAFYAKPPLKRFKIIIAGVLMNLALAWVFLSFGFIIGLPTLSEEKQAGGIIREEKIQITSVNKNSPADSAGIKAGDSIINIKNKISKIKNDEIAEIKKIQEFIDGHRGNEITLEIQRGKEIFNLSLVPRKNPPPDEGPLGITLAKTGIISFPWYIALYKGLSSAINLTIMFIVGLAQLVYYLIIGLPVMAEISGPVGIFNLTQQAANLGISYLLQFGAILSINLAIINSLPFPALDGGRLVFLAIEKIKGSPVSQKVEKAIHSAGFALLIILMVVITFRDIMKLF